MTTAEFIQPCTPRRDMPQLCEKDLLALLIFLTEHGVPVDTCVVEPTTLIFHQRVESKHIPKPGSPDLHLPILISSDNYIIDGHHRAAAHLRDGTRPVCFQLTVVFLQAVEAIFAFPQTFTYGDNEQ